MARTRKRKRTAPTHGESSTQDTPEKDSSKPSMRSGVQHPVLSQYYPQIQSLRDYIITKLPASSRIRRRKVSAVGITVKSDGTPMSDVERSLGALLDTTLVGLPKPLAEEDHRMEEWENFSHKGDESLITLSNGVAGFVESQALIVEYVVRALFKREKSAKWPDHLLCDGFRRNGGLGLRVVRSNPYVQALQSSPWPQLLALLGEQGDRIMIDLLLDCAIFVAVDVGKSNVCQLSGKPLSNVPLYFAISKSQQSSATGAPSEIVFIRNRIFYAKPALNARGGIQFGLKHIHVLNRSPFQQLREGEDAEMQTRLTRQNEVHTLKVMMYIFPRQFGLHNVFTSQVDPKETSQRLKDYTLREEEIYQKFGRLGDSSVHVKTPKRLRGCARDLVRRLQILHQRCSYSLLLQYYCPAHRCIIEPKVRTEIAESQKRVRKSKNRRGKDTVRLQKWMQLPSNQNFFITELATSSSEVSSFCQAVFKRLIPRKFWGSGSAGGNNELQFLKKVNRFILLRRFESMNLFELTQGIKITDMEWLAPPKLSTHRTSLTDIQKRQELLNEFLYFLFDSILIPLIRSNFYVTESNTDKYRVFFFRHDIWRSLVEPVMATFKGKMLEEISLTDARRILDSRRLGFSHIRLLPKGSQMRPITNLRKRIPSRANPKQLGPGINKILAPAHTVLQLEKVTNSDKIGSALFSVGDIYKRMKPFKSRMLVDSAQFYFAKVDVQSAFDTIPQAAIVSLLDSIPQQRRYQISKYLEVGPGIVAHDYAHKSKPVRRWPSVAIENGDSSTFIQRLINTRNASKRNTVFVDLYQQSYETRELLRLVASHIQQNIIKVGKKFYRQKQGIPQGSVLSSTLCNYFYADLEMHVLPFLDSDECLLLRLTDDFLLITTDKYKAVRFVEVLHNGIPEYGVTVNPQKSLVNFDLTVNGQHVPRLDEGKPFPYCGVLIDPKTLDIARSSNQDQCKSIYNSLTVEFSRTPGQTFQRKVLNAFKIQSHIMFFDTGLNSAATMLNNIHRAFVEAATKMWAYARCLPALKQPPPTIIIRTIEKLADTAYLLLVSRSRKLRYPEYTCDVKKCEVSWLAYNAFQHVLRRKQAKYGEVLAWLKAEITKLSILRDIRHGRVQIIV